MILEIFYKEKSLILFLFFSTYLSLKSAIIKIVAKNSDAPIVPIPMPPTSCDFVRKSPNVAPNGLVNTKAIQNNKTEDTFV